MTDYNHDFYGWTQEQAALLRSGRLAELDIDNLIEEIETMGRSERNALESRFCVLLVHLLKWHYQPVRRGTSWILTIKGQRLQLEKLIRINPGLKPEIQAVINDAYRLARIHAAKQTKLDLKIFPEACPWTLEQVVDDDFFPDSQ